MSTGSLRIKRLFDMLVAAALLLVLAPLLLVLAVAIRVSLGRPVLFRQQRAGWYGKPFTIYKFRTMTNACDSHGNLLPDAVRLTALGRFLRSTSLDELPELWNVLKGDMSLVGPRPVLPSHLPRYTDYQRRRLLMKPGITGLAQVNGRNTLRWSRRIRFDVWYVEHYSLRLDFRILVKTIKVLLLREGIVLVPNPHEVDDLALPVDTSLDQKS